jgi:hypothetical protein
MFPSFENIVVLDAEHDVQVAVGRAFAAGITFTGNAHLVSVIDAGGNLQFDGPFLHHTAFAPAGFAGILDDLPCSAALGTRARDAEEALLEAHLAVAVARRAGRRAAALLSPTAGTLDARLVTGILDLLRRTEGGVFEFEFEIVAKIRSALDSTSSATATEHISETENIAEHIAEVGKDARIEPPIPGSAAQAGMAVSVICRALLRIGQYGVGFRSFLESIFGLFVAGIAVRVVLQRELSIRALHFLVARRFRDAKNFVVISL